MKLVKLFVFGLVLCSGLITLTAFKKANVGEERSQTEKQDDLRPTALASANSKLKVEG